jgi:hypothetical protein
MISIEPGLEHQIAIQKLLQASHRGIRLEV